MRTSREVPTRVVVAGGGVAGLEAVLALRSIAPDGVDVTLVAPERHFVYRPLAVAERFGGAPVLRFPLQEIAADCGVPYVRDAVASVDPLAKRALTQDGRSLDYDALVLAVGARPVERIPGALAFRGPEDGLRVSAVVDEILDGEVGTVAFVVPPGIRWTLPMFELALTTAAALGGTSAARLTVVTHERSAMEIFGPAISDFVTSLLAARGVAVETDMFAEAVEDGRLWLTSQGSMPADRAIALPRLVGRRLPGVPGDQMGFVAVDAYGRVDGMDDFYAVGDMTTHPVKQGGIGAQQADAAASVIAARAGVNVEPAPCTEVLRGVLLTGDGVRYLRSGPDEPATMSDTSPWWPPGKISGRHLAPYLASRLDLAISSDPAISPAGHRAPEDRGDRRARARPGSDVGRPSLT